MNLSLVFGVLLAVSSVCRGQGASDEGQETSDGGDGYYYYPEQPSYPEQPVNNQAWTEGTCSRACTAERGRTRGRATTFPTAWKKWWWTATREAAKTLQCNADPGCRQPTTW